VKSSSNPANIGMSNLGKLEGFMGITPSKMTNQETSPKKCFCKIV
jgi:hypothetical protein